MGKEQSRFGAWITEKMYQGKFVALRSVTDDTVIAYGDDPYKVGRLAAEKGVDEPFIFFVSEADVTTVYQLSKYQL